MNVQPIIRVTKEFRFEAAHALKGYDGPCKNIHGHSYAFSVTITGNPLNEAGSSKLGMVMDFSDMKKLIKQHIVDPLDHALMICSNDPIESLKNTGEPFCNIISLPYQPTSENLLVDFAKRITKILPNGVKLHHMKLRETSTSYAEWYASDNE